MRTVLAVSLMAVVLSGCAVAAAPCRIASAGLRVIPVVGDVVAHATDACASIID